MKRRMMRADMYMEDAAVMRVVCAAVLFIERMASHAGAVCFDVLPRI